MSDIPDLPALGSALRSRLGTQGVLIGLAAGAPADLAGRALATNFVRLVDRAMSEWGATAERLCEAKATRDPATLIISYARAVSHMEGCIEAAHRAARVGEALRCRRDPAALDRRAHDVLEQVRRFFHEARNSSQHFEERARAMPQVGPSPCPLWFAPDGLEHLLEPDPDLSVGKLPYAQIVAHIELLAAAAEKVARYRHAVPNAPQL